MFTYLQRSTRNEFTALFLLVLGAHFVSGKNSISNGKNLALNKPSSQSSTCFDGTSELAVDGKKLPSYNDKSCTHTCRGLVHWWQVNLQDRYYVTQVFVTNRILSAQRLKNLKIQTSDTTTMDNPALCTYFTKNDIGSGETRRLDCDYPVPGQILRITIIPSGYEDYLTLCEVEIYGNKATNYTQHEVATVTDNTLMVKDEQNSFTEIPAPSDPYQLRTRAGDIDSFQTTPDYVTASDYVDTISGRIHDYSQTTTFVSSETMTKVMENSKEYFSIIHATVDDTSDRAIDTTPLMTVTYPDTTIKEINDLTISMATSSRVQPSLLLCECPCQEESKFDDKTNLQEKLNILRKELTVLKNQTNLYKRRLTSAEDERWSSAVLGTAGFVVLISVPVISVLCDAPRIARFLKMKHLMQRKM